MAAETVVIVGSGQTGRGMLGALFFEEGRYRLVFADNDEQLVLGLREQGWYEVESRDFLAGTSVVTRVEGFVAVDTVRERGRYVAELAGATYVAVAVFPESFGQVATDLADMVRERMRRGVKEPVAVILGGNFVGLRAYFERALMERLDEEGRAHAAANVALLTSKANRKVVNTGPMPNNRFALTGDNKCVLPVDDRLPFGRGYRPPSFFQLDTNVELSMVEKIWSENLFHCALGFMGEHAGFSTVNEAIEDDRIRMLSYYAWLEGRQALERAYGISVPDEESVRQMLARFDTPYFQDSIHRVARQPMRKLGRHDRFIGPALLCVRNGIVPYFITKAAAHGFCYRRDQEPQSVDLADLVASEGVEAAVDAVCQLDVQDKEECLVRALLVDAVREIQGPDAAPAHIAL